MGDVIGGAAFIVLYFIVFTKQFLSTQNRKFNHIKKNFSTSKRQLSVTQWRKFRQNNISASVYTRFLHSYLNEFS